MVRLSIVHTPSSVVVKVTFTFVLRGFLRLDSRRQFLVIKYKWRDSNDHSSCLWWSVWQCDRIIIFAFLDKINFIRFPTEKMCTCFCMYISFVHRYIVVIRSLFGKRKPSCKIVFLSIDGRMQSVVVFRQIEINAFFVVPTQLSILF